MLEPMWTRDESGSRTFIGCCAECDIWVSEEWIDRHKVYYLFIVYGNMYAPFCIYLVAEDRLDYRMDWEAHVGLTSEEVERRLQMILDFTRVFAPYVWETPAEVAKANGMPYHRAMYRFKRGLTGQDLIAPVRR